MGDEGERLAFALVQPKRNYPLSFLVGMHSMDFLRVVQRCRFTLQKEKLLAVLLPAAGSFNFPFPDTAPPLKLLER
jgi:hypothetical protein